MNPSFDEIIKSTRQLPAAEQEKIRQWLNDKGPTYGEGDRSRAHANRSARTLEWLPKTREKYLGQWVALDGDRLIASGQTAKEVYSKASAGGVQIPFVELVTEQESVPFIGGWLRERTSLRKTYYYSTLKAGINLTVMLCHGQESVEVRSETSHGFQPLCFKRAHGELLCLDIESTLAENIGTITGSFKAHLHTVTVEVFLSAQKRQFIWLRISNSLEAF